MFSLSATEDEVVLPYTVDKTYSKFSGDVNIYDFVLNTCYWCLSARVLPAGYYSSKLGLMYDPMISVSGWRAAVSSMYL